MNIKDDASIETEMTFSIPEHQTLISWNTDEQNEAFEYWLQVEGFKLFEEWMDKPEPEEEDI